MDIWNSQTDNIDTYKTKNSTHYMCLHDFIFNFFDELIAHSFKGL